jgi:raffinose/stachyose/melibiose transport system permease protein
MKALKYHVRSHLFILPSLLLTLALGIYPVLWAMRYMFYDYPGYGEEVYVGLANFGRLSRDHLFWSSVWNTFVYAGGKLVLTIPVALLLAVILNQKLLRGKNLLRAIFFMPTVISSAVMAVIFFIIFNSYNGILNQFLIKFHLISENVEWLGPHYAMLAAIIVAAWGAVGNYMLLFIAGLQGIPDDLYESASMDGATPVQQFWYITIPMLGPILQMIMLLAITASLKGYESIMVMTQGGPIGKTEVMYLYVYKLFFPTPGNLAVDQQIGYGSAVGFVTALIVGAVTLAYFYMSKRLNRIY